MEKSKLAVAIDEFIRAVAIWLLSAICIRYAIKELYAIILIATAITMLATLLIRYYYAKKNVSYEKIKKTDEAMRELIVADRKDLLLSLSEAVCGNMLEDAIETEHTIIYPYFYGRLPLDKLNYAYNLARSNDKKLLVLCESVSTEVEKNIDLFSDIPVSLLNKNKTYAFLEEHQLLPATKKRAKKKASIFKVMLKRSKIKGYLATALILLVTAAFSPYSLLCIIMAAFNITMSILCEVKGY